MLIQRRHSVECEFGERWLMNAGAMCGGRQRKEGELITAKFHFVDLAGSERVKRTVQPFPFPLSAFPPFPLSAFHPPSPLPPSPFPPRTPLAMLMHADRHECYGGEAALRLHSVPTAGGRALYTVATC